jgi:hypothetical protein
MGTSPNITTVNTLEEYVRAINGIQVRKDRIVVFRGHNERGDFQPQPLVYREAEYIANESELIREIIARSPDDFSLDHNFLERLVRLQHYGLPTRLLDVTFNALAALFFACMEKEKTEGEVVVFSIPRTEFKYFDSDTVALLSALSNRSSSFDVNPMPNDFDAFNREQEILRIVHDVRADKPGFEPKIIKDDLKRIVCVQPKLSNKRIARQDGAFLLYGVAGKKTECPALPSDWISRGVGKKRIVFTKKHSLKTELSKFGIARHTLFPELEVQTSYVMSKFKEKYKRDASKSI